MKLMYMVFSEHPTAARSHTGNRNVSARTPLTTISFANATRRMARASVAESKLWAWHPGTDHVATIALTECVHPSAYPTKVAYSLSQQASSSRLALSIAQAHRLGTAEQSS
jgi:hypothetical protein